MLREFMKTCRHSFKRDLLKFLTIALILTRTLQAGSNNGRLDVYWVDVEGGAATLIVTPSNESILIDTGNPGQRDSDRIHHVLSTVAGLQKVDHLIVTHFHRDHFGGAADLAKRIPIGRIYDNGIPESDPDGRPNNLSFEEQIRPYRDIQSDARIVLNPGDLIPLKQTVGSPRLALRCLAARQKMVEPATSLQNTALCESALSKAEDRSDNANSNVTLLTFGDFELFIGGDLSWNVEAQLVCPVNRVGIVDVYQVDHHGLDQSNNPVLVRSLAPTVAVMSNGTRKGCQPETFATLKSVSSIQATYQIHKNLRSDSENNTDSTMIANLEANCSGNHIELSVDQTGSSYTVRIPANGHKKTFSTK